MNNTPMRVIDIQAKERQLGRIRLGTKVNGNPTKLATFRLTSNDKAALDRAAAIYGGTVKPWEGGTERFELITERPEIPVIVCQAASTSYEHWGVRQGQGMVCLKRCDGCFIRGGVDFPAGHECQCHPDPKERAALSKKKGSTECSLKTRLSVRLPELPDYGVWRVDTGGYFAATEIPLTSDGLAALVAQRIRIPTTLAIEIRKSGNKKFPVPVLRMNATMDDVLALVDRQQGALEQGGASIAPELVAGLPTRQQKSLPTGDGDFNDG